MSDLLSSYTRTIRVLLNAMREREADLLPHLAWIVSGEEYGQLCIELSEMSKIGITDVTLTNDLSILGVPVIVRLDSP